MINANFTIPQAKLDAGGNIVLDVSMNLRSIDQNTGLLIGSPSIDTVLLPHYISATNSTGLNLEYIYLRDADELSHYLNDKKSYSRIYSTATITGATATGLPNDATLFTATFTVQGIDYAFSVAGSSLQTYTQVLTQIDTLLSGVATSSLVDLVGENTHIEVLLDDYGLISITDGNLFSSLNMTIQPPFHNRYDVFPFLNNAQLNDTESRAVNYILIVSPGGASSAVLDFHCSEFTAK